MVSFLAKEIHVQLIKFKEETDFVCSVEKDLFHQLMERAVREQLNALELSSKVLMEVATIVGPVKYPQVME